MSMGGTQNQTIREIFKIRFNYLIRSFHWSFSRVNSVFVNIDYYRLQARLMSRRLMRDLSKTFYEKKTTRSLEYHKKVFLFWRKYSDFLAYLFIYYLTFDHSFGLTNQDHFEALLNGDPDATNNTSESINKCLKTYVSTGNKNTHIVFRSIYNYKMN